MEKVKLKKKICLLGSYGVGKTSLVRKFVYNKFEDKYLSTIGVNISKKVIIIENDNEEVEIELFIWDIANIEKFDLTVKSYLRGAHGAIIVTDISRPNTAEKITDYINEFLNVNPKAKMVCVGNKFDLAEELNFNKDDYISKFNAAKCPIFFSSAKSGENVEEVFNSLGIQLIGEK